MSVFDDADAFLRTTAGIMPFAPGTARGAFLVSPDGFGEPSETRNDNRYMVEDAIDRERALAEHRALARALTASLPVTVFPGDPEAPDAVFPNNAFGTAAGRYVVGRMRWPVRRRETARQDIRAFFRDVLGYREIDLSTRHELVAELTGSLVIDRARGIGYCGTSERCDALGAAAMHEAFGLRATFRFALAAGEYHTNVVMSSLAGRLVVIAPSGFAREADAEAVVVAHGGRAVILSEAEKAAFAGNCIALDARTVWMSERAADALAAHNRRSLEQAGFRIASVALHELEKAGGSLRCCVGEIF
ncbi:MAG TPA: arginine deiminase-related protein [Xanthomonadaceae bacterium]|nr:arginine deiminase-related protein [Xanthomonadaceae bacterium]